MTDQAPATNKLLNAVGVVFVTAFGFGYAPLVPGTVGTLPAVAVFLVVAYTAAPATQTLLIGLFLLLSCVISVLLGSWAEKFWSSRDPKPFVLDEVAGFFLTVFLYAGPSPILTALWAFLASRFFDIVKPPPAAWMERLSGGWGILLDDLIASLYAAASLHIASWVLPGLF